MATDRPAAIVHRTKVSVPDPTLSPTLYGAECSCGWRAEYLATDPEAAEWDAAQHESEARDAD